MLVLPLQLCSQMLADRESRPRFESLIVEIVKTLPQGVSLKGYFCVDCLTLLVLDGTIPGKFLTPLIHSKYDQHSFVLRLISFSCSSEVARSRRAFSIADSP